MVVVGKLKYLPWRVEGRDIHSSFSTTKHINNGVYEILFDDGWKSTATSSQLRSGTMKSPFHKGTFGVGCMGDGYYNYKDHNKVHQTWSNMLKRCYDCSYRDYHLYGGRGVTVCKEWHNFQNFAEWYTNNYKEGYVLDKDLKGSGKEYSPSECLMLPSIINTFITNSMGKKGKNPYTGVYESGNNYITRCCQLDNCQKHLGSYKTAQEAYDVYEKEKVRLAKILATDLENSIGEEAYNYLTNFDKYIRNLTINPYTKGEKQYANRISK